MKSKIISNQPAASAPTFTFPGVFRTESGSLWFAKSETEALRIVAGKLINPERDWVPEIGDRLCDLSEEYSRIVPDDSWEQVREPITVQFN